MRRVAITGLGFVSSLGLNVRRTWEQVLAGGCGIGPLRHLQMPREPVQIAAQVEMARRGGRRFNFCEHIAMMAARECLQEADLEGYVPSRRGVFQGASASGIPAGERYATQWLAGRAGHVTEPLRESSPLITDSLARVVGATGPRSTIMNACSSSLMALGEAWERIATGEIDLALAGGCEGLCRTTFAGFASLKAMDANPCRPFSQDRAGLNLGEGSAQLLLEEMHSAKARGAVILGELLGYGVAMDAHHPTAPHPDGLGAARAMSMALNCARLNPAEIDLVSAHGTATSANDVAECRAIRRALGDAADRVSVTSSKSQFGHALAAAGVFGTAVALLSLRDQVVSPTLRLENQDPGCDLDCTPLQPKSRPVRYALVNAFAFGGNNVCLALGRWEGK